MFKISDCMFETYAYVHVEGQPKPVNSTVLENSRVAVNRDVHCWQPPEDNYCCQEGISHENAAIIASCANS